jgi:hypothetical protein
MVFDPVVDTLPMVGLMETVVAPATFQDSVVDCPAVMVAGVALKPLMDGLPGLVTVTVAHARVEPEILEAVSIYSVVAPGFTDCEPLADTVPISGLMETVWAPLTAQSSFADPPVLMDSGLALKEVIEGGENQFRTAPLVA